MLLVKSCSYFFMCILNFILFLLFIIRSNICSFFLVLTFSSMFPHVPMYFITTPKDFQVLRYLFIVILGPSLFSPISFFLVIKSTDISSRIYLSEAIIPVSTQSPPTDLPTEVPSDETYQKIDAVGDSNDKTRHNYSSIGTINNNINNTNNNSSHNHSTFKAQSQSQAQSQAQSQIQSQVQSQGPPTSVSNNSRPNNTNVHIPINSSFQSNRHNMTKSTESRVQHMSRYNSQSLSIPHHHHLHPCLSLGPADISVPPPPFAHPPPSIQSDGYNQMQP